nr:MAG TPA: hypothetical protein [Caudoviricetes sp.]
MSKCIAVTANGVEMAYFPYHDQPSFIRADEEADKFIKTLCGKVDGAWKGISYPRVRVTTASGIVYEASLCHVDIDDSHGEERMFSFWYIPALGRCKYAAIIPETVEYIQ